MTRSLWDSCATLEQHNNCLRAQQHATTAGCSSQLEEVNNAPPPADAAEREENAELEKRLMRLLLIDGQIDNHCGDLRAQSKPSPQNLLPVFLAYYRSESQRRNNKQHQRSLWADMKRCVDAPTGHEDQPPERGRDIREEQVVVQEEDWSGNPIGGSQDPPSSSAAAPLRRLRRDVVCSVCLVLLQHCAASLHRLYRIYTLVFPDATIEKAFTQHYHASQNTISIVMSISILLGTAGATILHGQKFFTSQTIALQTVSFLCGVIAVTIGLLTRSAGRRLRTLETANALCRCLVPSPSLNIGCCGDNNSSGTAALAALKKQQRIIVGCDVGPSSCRNPLDGRAAASCDAPAAEGDESVSNVSSHPQTVSDAVLVLRSIIREKPKDEVVDDAKSPTTGVLEPSPNLPMVQQCGLLSLYGCGLFLCMAIIESKNRCSLGSGEVLGRQTCTESIQFDGVIVGVLCGVALLAPLRFHLFAVVSTFIVTTLIWYREVPSVHSSSKELIASYSLVTVSTLVMILVALRYRERSARWQFALYWTMTHRASTMVKIRDRTLHMSDDGLHVRLATEAQVTRALRESGNAKSGGVWGRSGAVVVCAFSLQGYARWCSLRGPSDAVHVLLHVTEVLDAMRFAAKHRGCPPPTKYQTLGDLYIVMDDVESAVEENGGGGAACGNNNNSTSRSCSNNSDDPRRLYVQYALLCLAECNMRLLPLVNDPRSTVLDHAQFATKSHTSVEERAVRGSPQRAGNSASAAPSNIGLCLHAALDMGEGHRVFASRYRSMLAAGSCVEWCTDAVTTRRRGAPDRCVLGSRQQALLPSPACVVTDDISFASLGIKSSPSDDADKEARVFALEEFAVMGDALSASLFPRITAVVAETAVPVTSRIKPSSVAFSVAGAAPPQKQLEGVITLPAEYCTWLRTALFTRTLKFPLQHDSCLRRERPSFSSLTFISLSVPMEVRIQLLPSCVSRRLSADAVHETKSGGVGETSLNTEASSGTAAGSGTSVFDSSASEHNNHRLLCRHSTRTSRRKSAAAAGVTGASNTHEGEEPSLDAGQTSAAAQRTSSTPKFETSLLDSSDAFPVSGCNSTDDVILEGSHGGKANKKDCESSEQEHVMWVPSIVDEQQQLCCTEGQRRDVLVASRTVLKQSNSDESNNNSNNIISSLVESGAREEEYDDERVAAREPEGEVREDRAALFSAAGPPHQQMLVQRLLDVCFRRVHTQTVLASSIQSVAGSMMVTFMSCFIASLVQLFIGVIYLPREEAFQRASRSPVVWGSAGCGVAALGIVASWVIGNRRRLFGMQRCSERAARNMKVVFCAIQMFHSGLYMAAVFSAERGANVLGNGQLVWFYVLWVLSLLRYPRMWGPFGMCFLDAADAVAFLVFVLAFYPFRSRAFQGVNVFLFAVHLVYTPFIRFAVEAQLRDIFLTEVQLRCLSIVLDEDYRSLEVAVAALAPSAEVAKETIKGMRRMIHYHHAAAAVMDDEDSRDCSGEEDGVAAKMKNASGRLDEFLRRHTTINTNVGKRRRRQRRQDNLSETPTDAETTESGDDPIDHDADYAAMELLTTMFMTELRDVPFCILELRDRISSATTKDTGVDPAPPRVSSSTSHRFSQCGSQTAEVGTSCSTSRRVSAVIDWIAQQAADRYHKVSIVKRGVDCVLIAGHAQLVENGDGELVQAPGQTDAEAAQEMAALLREVSSEFVRHSECSQNSSSSHPRCCRAFAGLQWRVFADYGPLIGAVVGSAAPSYDLYGASMSAGLTWLRAEYVPWGCAAVTVRLRSLQELGAAAADCRGGDSRRTEQKESVSLWKHPELLPTRVHLLSAKGMLQRYELQEQ